MLLNFQKWHQNIKSLKTDLCISSNQHAFWFATNQLGLQIIELENTINRSHNSECRAYIRACKRDILTFTNFNNIRKSNLFDSSNVFEAGIYPVYYNVKNNAQHIINHLIMFLW